MSKPPISELEAASNAAAAAREQAFKELYSFLHNATTLYGRDDNAHNAAVGLRLSQFLASRCAEMRSEALKP